MISKIDYYCKHTISTGSKTPSSSKIHRLWKEESHLNVFPFPECWGCVQVLPCRKSTPSWYRCKGHTVSDRLVVKTPTLRHNRSASVSMSVGMLGLRPPHSPPTDNLKVLKWVLMYLWQELSLTTLSCG